MKHFKLERDNDGILLITFDSPGRSMNVLSNDVIQEIIKFTEQIKTDEALFEGAYTLNKTFRDLETCGKPIAAAVNGLALGGGFEIVLACHARFGASDNPSVKMGLPEALIGLLPGAGGTQRLPRLVGLMGASAVLLQGKQLTVSEAQGMGILQGSAPTSELVDTAKQWVKDNPKAKAPWDEDRFRFPGGAPYTPKGLPMFAGASAMVRKESYGNYPAMGNILKAVYEGAQVPMDAALRIESRYFCDLLLRPESANMTRSLFLSKQALEKGEARPKGQEKGEVSKVGVIGAGFMGAGVAYVSARAGLDVVLIDRDQEGADKGKQFTVDEQAKRVKRGKTTQEKADKIAGRITATTDYALLKDVDLIVEAVFENSELKAKITKMGEEAKMAGMPVGPLSLQDEVAIDLAYKVMQQTKADLGSQYDGGKIEPIITKMYESDRLGRKNEKGFYVYKGREKHLWPELGQFAENGILEEQPNVQDVKDRIMYAQAIEAARTMAEGIVHDPREADLGSIFGWGFAPFTGGAISFIDTIGAKRFIKRADELVKAYGPQFEVPKLLREMAESFKDGVATIKMDDGKANVLSTQMLADLNEAFDKAESDDAIVVLTGRDGMFSGGFNLKEMQTGPHEAMILTSKGSKLARRILEFKRPVVLLATGHTIAMGAFLALACDYRVIVDGDYKIGLNETMIGMTMHNFGIELARYRLSKPMAAPMIGQMFGALNKTAFSNTKRRSRKAIFEVFDQAIKDDLDPEKIHAV